MTLPVSSYEELLVQVRELTHETILLQRQLSSDLFQNADPPDVNQNFSFGQKNYEQGKHLTDKVIQQYEKNSKGEIGHSPLTEYNNLRFRAQFCPSLEGTEGVRAGELTRRLLAWRSRTNQPVILQDGEICEKSAERLFPEENRISRGSTGVGVESIRLREGPRRPHGIELPTPLGNVAALELESFVDVAAAAFNSAFAVASPATSARYAAIKNVSSTSSSSSACSSSIPTFVNVKDLRQSFCRAPVIAERNKEDAMEPEVKEEDERRSSTPSPEDGKICGRSDKGLLLERKRISMGSAAVDVESASVRKGPSMRPRGIEVPTALSNVAALEPESSVDAAAAAYSSAVAVAVASPATYTRCAAVKNAPNTPFSSYACSSSSTTSVNVKDLRPRFYLGPAITDRNKEDAMGPEVKEEDERRSSTPSPEVYVRRSRHYNDGGSSEEENKPETSLPSRRLPSSYRGTWPIRRDLWANQQMGFSPQQSTASAVHTDVASVMSFSSNSGVGLGCSTEMQGDRRLGAKVDVVYNLLGMLGSTEGREDMSATLLSMSNSMDSCLVMRQSGCLPLLVQLIHAPGQDPQTRERASRALHNVVHAKSDERAGRREARVLRFLEQLRDYCQALRVSLETGQVPDDFERHPGPTIAALMKLSFDEAHRHAMCQLGGLHAVAELIEMDHMAHGSECDDQNCITLRRYAGMALTNLTFGDGNNKALLCSFREFMKALVSQLRSLSDDLRQVTASVLRNLSWRADTSSKRTLREVGAVTGLMKAAMEGRKESTLKSILSALWNLSAHCSTNKVDICAVDGALAFLVDMLSYKAPSKTLAIVENAGGILRNVSSHIAVRDDYRAIVRERGCLQVLLQQLRSPSLTVVSNACGALWNLSARCPQDQRLLWDLGAVPMLRSLVHSKHKMISMGSSAALKNLLSARPGASNLVHLDSTARGLGLPTLPTLVARRQRALEQEIDQNLAETCDNIEPSTSPTNKDDKFSFKVDHSFLGINARALRSYQLHNQPSTSNGKSNGVARSESRDSMRSITSTHSDTMFERVNRHVMNGMSPTDIQMKQQSSSLHAAVGFDCGISNESHTKTTTSEKKYTLRYKNAIPDRLKPSEAFNDISDLKCTNSTISWSSAPEQDSACSQTLLHSSVEENLSAINQSTSSTSKTDSQSSISEEAELTVTAKTEYQRVSTKSTIDKPALHSPLDTIQKVITPTISHNSEGNLFSDYAETDLDQPTDYSLRYAERTMEDDEKQHSAYFESREQELIHEDTIKTYCTEGTPYETPLNSSRAASASDLQEDTRLRNSSKKALDHGKSENKELDSYESLECHTEMEPVREMNLTSASQLMDTQERVEESKDSAVRTQLRNTPVQHSSSELQCNPSENAASASIKVKSDQMSDGDEDDEDLLTACINIGMQNNRHRHSFIGNSFEKLPRAESNLARYQTSVALDLMECNQTGEYTMNNVDTNSAESEETMTDAREDVITDTLQNQNAPSYNSHATKNSEEELPGKSIKLSIPTITMDSFAKGDKVLESPLEQSTNNIQHIPITGVTHTGAYSEEDRLRYLKDQLGIGKNSAALSIDSESGNISKDVKDKIVENSNMQQSYTKVTDSESSESIDSVERSEHALLELCIQPGIKKSTDIVSTNEGTSKYDQVFTETRINQANHLSERDTDQRDTCETDGINIKETTETIVKSVQTNSCGIIKQADEEVYRRQRDPDAMIASLDRLTATLVQQTEAMRERDSGTMKQSVMSDTWNEDSPNEVSFPSISISAPIIGSFKSDVPDEPGTITSENVETVSSESGNMTSSKIIRREAIKLAEAVESEMEKHSVLETSSMTAMDLDAIKPPSTMGSLLSLTASYAGQGESNEIVNRDRCYSTSLPPVQLKTIPTADTRNGRKKSLPLGVVAKRALSQGQSYAGSLENLLNECNGSHLDSVKPPSMMDELPDAGDMENSMLSVASITSEVADTKEHDSHSLTCSDPVFDLLKPVANVLSMTCMRYAEAMQSSGNNSLSECLENINPPSLFNEVCEMDESTMEPASETICSDTLCIDVELNTEEVAHSMIVDKIDEGDNDTDEGATPLSSEYCVSSSAESTPKKRVHKNLTPKQKRNLAKERYRTYTIAAEIVKKEEERRKQEGIGGEEDRIPRGKCSPFSKLTPKQRRQEDRARFQTQVLEIPFPDVSVAQNTQTKSEDVCQRESSEKVVPTSPVKSAIPTLTKLPICKGLRKRQMGHRENKERYRTRTLNESESILRDGDANATSNVHLTEDSKLGTEIGNKSDDIHMMLEQNATIVLNTLNESNKTNECTGESILIDCETISLVSNESESERNLRLQFVNGLSKKLIDSQQACHAQNIPQDDCNPGGTVESGVEHAQQQLDISSPVESESENDSNHAEEQPQETKRPRIIKPGMSRDLSTDSNVTDKSEPESPKAIRGRRKALYSNPITRKSTPQSSPLKQVHPVSGIPIGRSNTSPIVRTTRATTLRQTNNSSSNAVKDASKANTSPKISSVFTDSEKRTQNISVASKRASVPQKGSSLTFTKSVKRHSTPSTCSSNFQNDSKTEPPVKPLERQGTFTKDEPEVENAPTVVSTNSSPVRTRIAKPIRGASTKVHPAVGKSKISVKTHQVHQTKTTKTNISDKAQPPKPLPMLVAPKRLPPGKQSATNKPAPSTQNAQVENSKVFRKIGSLGQRSNSNSSIVSNTSNGMQTRKLAKEATSKIASLWKKVEENKNKQRYEKPDRRHWIQPNGCTSEVDGPGAGNKPPAFRLFRSSTFEGVPQENESYKSKSKRPLVMGVQNSRIKYRNSCDLSGMNANDAPCKIPVKAGDSKKDSGDSTVVLRKQQSGESSTGSDSDPTKRISRLGSFIRVDPSSTESSTQMYINGNCVRTPASAIVPPFNYNPKQDIPSQTNKVASEESQRKFGITDCHTEIVTASTRVTTV